MCSKHTGSGAKSARVQPEILHECRICLIFLVFEGQKVSMDMWASLHSSKLTPKMQSPRRWVGGQKATADESNITLHHLLILVQLAKAMRNSNEDLQQAPTCSALFLACQVGTQTKLHTSTELGNLWTGGTAELQVRLCTCCFCPNIFQSRIPQIPQFCLSQHLSMQLNHTLAGTIACAGLKTCHLCMAWESIDRICTVLIVMGICFTLTFACLIAKDHCSD